MSFELLNDVAVDYPMTITRGDPCRVQIEIEHVRDYVNLGTARIRADIRATNQVDGSLVATFEIEIIDQAKGIFHIWLPEETVEAFATGTLGYLFVTIACAETNYEEKIIGRGLVTVE